MSGLLTNTEILSILRAAFTVSIPQGAHDALANACQAQHNHTMVYLKAEGWKSHDEIHVAVLGACANGYEKGLTEGRAEVIEWVNENYGWLTGGFQKDDMVMSMLWEKWQAQVKKWQGEA